MDTIVIGVNISHKLRNENSLQKNHREFIYNFPEFQNYCALSMIAFRRSDAIFTSAIFAVNALISDYDNDNLSFVTSQERLKVTALLSLTSYILTLLSSVNTNCFAIV